MVAMATTSWQPYNYGINFIGNIRENVSPFPMFIILITESQIWYVCVDHLSSQMLLYLIFAHYGCHGNRFYYTGIAQHPNATLICLNNEYMLGFVNFKY